MCPIHSVAQRENCARNLSVRERTGCAGATAFDPLLGLGVTPGLRWVASALR
jgi:hypothetical protein